MISVFVLFLAYPLFGADVPRRYDGYQIVRVDAGSPAELAAIEATGADILNCSHGVGPLDLLVSPDQRIALARMGKTLQVLQRDVQGAVDSQKAGVAVAGGDPFADFYLSYHEYGNATAEGTIVWYMDQLAVRYPGLISVVSVGTTHEGRTIWGLRVTSNVNPTKPGVSYFGCEHAREWITTTVPLYLARHLVENYGTDPGITDLVDNVEFFLVPVMNVDGYIYTWTIDRFWRKNRRFLSGSFYGVDLNRNWEEGWGGPGSSASLGSSTYRGPFPFSEPETVSMRDFFLAHPNIRGQLDIHSYGQLILWPYGYTPDPSPDDSAFADVGYAMRDLIAGVHSELYDAGPTYTTIYPASGLSIDWTYVELGILSMAFECRDTGTFGFTLPENQIIPQNEELLPAILHFTNSDWIRETAPAPSVQAPGSRYLVITPSAGFPDVALRVKSPDFPCLDKYVDIDGYLTETPVSQSASTWGTVLVGDADIIPNTTYFVVAEYPGGVSSVEATVTTRKLGDTVPPWGVVNFLDISGIVGRFRGIATAPPLAATDIDPAVPNRMVDFADITLAVDEFRYDHRPYVGPVPCS